MECRVECLESIIDDLCMGMVCVEFWFDNIEKNMLICVQVVIVVFVVVFVVFGGGWWIVQQYFFFIF